VSSAVEPTGYPEWDRAQRVALITAAAGAGTFLVLGALLYRFQAISAPLQFFLSYLVAFNFWLGIALGCLVMLMLQYCTGGVWGFVLRRVLEAATRTLPLLALLFVPLLFGLHWLYLWAGSQQLEELQHKALYLNVPFFVARAIGYFAIWMVVAYWLNRWSLAQDRGTLRYSGRCFRLLGAPGLMLYGGTITFASIDWVMSLEPFWYSTIFPVLFAVGQVLTGLAFAIAVLILLATRQPLAGVITKAHQRDLGNLLLAFVMLWAYMSFSQFLLIWVGDLPEEIPWYLRRTRGGWQAVAVLLVLCHFALPFLLLLSRDIKENRRLLATVAIGILVMRYVDVFWWIEPAYPHENEYGFWLLDLAATVGMGGIWVWWFVWQLRKYPLLPLHDLPLEEVKNHE
jgi:hypothetical protein